MAPNKPKLRAEQRTTRRRLDMPYGAVLIVADDPGNLELLRFALEDAGVAYRAARSASEALTALRGGMRPGLVFVDWRAPPSSGVAFALDARRIDGLSSLPVVVMSRLPDPGSLAGVTGFLLKPFRLEELLDVVRAHGIPVQTRLPSTAPRP